MSFWRHKWRFPKKIKQISLHIWWQQTQRREWPLLVSSIVLSWCGLIRIRPSLLSVPNGRRPFWDKGENEGKREKTTMASMNRGALTFKGLNYMSLTHTQSWAWLLIESTFTYTHTQTREKHARARVCVCLSHMHACAHAVPTAPRHRSVCLSR